MTQKLVLNTFSSLLFANHFCTLENGKVTFKACHVHRRNMLFLFQTFLMQIQYIDDSVR